MSKSFFNQLDRNRFYEPINYNSGKIVIPQNALNNISDKILMSSSKINRKGYQILKPVYINTDKSRPLFDSYDGRNLSLLNSIKENSKKDYPDSFSEGREVIGRI